jgi:hypothetical protein
MDGKDAEFREEKEIFREHIADVCRETGDSNPLDEVYIAGFAAGLCPEKTVAC